MDETLIAFLRVRLEEVEDNDDPGQRVLHDIDAQRLILDAFEAALVDDSPTRALLPGLRLAIRLLATGVRCSPVVP
jgi:hypothetical protein